MTKAQVKGWSLPARLLHWLTVFLILVQIPIGFLMVDAYDEYKKTWEDDSLFMSLSLWHNTLGFVLLIVLFFRLGWRVSHDTPDLPDGLRVYQRMLAKLTHFFLYALLLIYPLSGWAALSAYEFEFPIFFFGWDSVPGIVPSVKEGSSFFDYPFFAGIHKACWKLGAAVLGLHVIGAIWHQWVRKDAVLTRMIRSE